jgi:hypothetical protein
MAAIGALFNFEQVSASTYHVYLLQLATAAGQRSDALCSIRFSRQATSMRASSPTPAVDSNVPSTDRTENAGLPSVSPL